MQKPWKIDHCSLACLFLTTYSAVSYITQNYQSKNGTVHSELSIKEIHSRFTHRPVWEGAFFSVEVPVSQMTPVDIKLASTLGCHKD